MRLAPASLATMILAAALGFGASPAGAVTVTVGTNDLSSRILRCQCVTCGLTFAQTALTESGARLSTPTDGTITAWRIQGIPGKGGGFFLRVLRPAGSGRFQGAGRSAAASHFDGTANTAGLPVQAGDQIGVDLTGSNASVYRRDGVPGAAYATWRPQLTGTALAPKATVTSGSAYEFNATVQLTAPTVSRVTPAVSDRRTVTIRGAHLKGATAVAFGSAQATSFTVDSNAQVTATAPSGHTGTVDVTVRTPAGTSKVSNADLYTYPPAGSGGGAPEDDVPSTTVKGAPDVAESLDGLGATAGGALHGAGAIASGLPYGGSVAGAISALRASPATFKAARSGASIARATGAKISYRNTQAGLTRFTVLGLQRGVRAGSRGCVKPRRGVRGARCTRSVAVGSFSHRDVLGPNSFHFTGRVAGHRLKRGRYVLRAVPGAGTGAVVDFRIV